MRLGIIGGGRAAWAFGSAWRSAGDPVIGVALREASPSGLPELLAASRTSIEEVITRADLVLVAVSDDALPLMCGKLAALARDEVWLFHASGSHPASLFAPHARSFSLHPLRSLPPRGADGALDDALLVVEGPEEALEVAEAIALRARARLTRVTAAAKATYHAAAVLAANYPAALLSMSERLLAGAGVEGVGVDDLAALAISAIENWRRSSGTARFTGPVVRGDEAVVRKHLDLLSAEPTMKATYASLALALCEIVLERDPDNPRVMSIHEALRALPLP
ncbi:MAG: DUF2520 domain-containing protein [Thermoanaerobaculia bacterium]|jgi:predicted short-subunit dehydrogenase-like oxidoreductase (DUF2520 family)